MTASRSAADIREQAERQGYLFCPGLVPGEVVHALRDVALAVARDLGWLDAQAPVSDAIAVPDVALGAYDDPRWIQFLRVVLPHPAFAALRAEPRVVGVLEAIFGGPVAPDAGDLCRVVSADDPTHTTVAHQDRFYLSGDGARWTMWLPLDDCPLALGPLEVLPRSHRQGLRPHRGDCSWRQGVEVGANAPWASYDFHTGDAIFFSWLTVHRALPNRSGRRLRLSATCRYRDAGSSSS